jgi:hypothetical protein
MLPSTEKRLISYKLVIREMLDCFNSRSSKCMYRLKHCRCLHAGNKPGTCEWPFCPLGEEE